jgi:hypothetical protein
LCHKTGLAFLLFFYDFGEFCNISDFIEKKEKQKKRKKACMGLVQPTTKLAQLQRFNPGRKRSPPEEAHSDLDILHQEEPVRFAEKP